MRKPVPLKNKTLLLLLLFFLGCQNRNNIPLKTHKTEEHLQEKTENVKKLSQFVDNEDYFVRDIDINKDGILDKVVSSAQNAGNELYFFQKNDNQYKLVLESINFSEDGGRLIDDISPVNNSNEVLSIATFFPKGINKALYYVVYKNNDWLLSKTVYTLGSWQEDHTKKQVCNVVQNIKLRTLTEENGFQQFQQIPIESKRQELCNIVYDFENSLIEFVKRFENDNSNIYSNVDRYDALLNQFTLTKKNVLIYNDIAYYLEQRKFYSESIFLLEKILNKFPERTVAYVNIADAYWGLNEKTKAQTAYRKYIELMEQSNKKHKIPPYVFERIR